jgi:hypothetical protein
VSDSLHIRFNSVITEIGALSNSSPDEFVAWLLTIAGTDIRMLPISSQPTEIAHSWIEPGMDTSGQDTWTGNFVYLLPPREDQEPHGVITITWEGEHLVSGPICGSIRNRLGPLLQIKAIPAPKKRVIIHMGCFHFLGEADLPGSWAAEYLYRMVLPEIKALGLEPSRAGVFDWEAMDWVIPDTSSAPPAGISISAQRNKGGRPCDPATASRNAEIYRLYCLPGDARQTAPQLAKQFGLAASSIKTIVHQQRKTDGKLSKLKGDKRR